MEQETWEDIIKSCREQRELREAFGLPKALIDPKYRMSAEDREFIRDEQETYQLDKMGYRP